MSYTVQIDVLDTAVLDGTTFIDFTNPGTSLVQSDDRFVVTLQPGLNFGAFDPGDLVGLPSVPYLMLSVSIAAPTMPMAAGGTIALAGPAAVGSPITNRKLLRLLGPPLGEGILLQPELFPFDHILKFFTDPGDPGPYRIVMTFEPFRSTKQPNGEDLPAAWAAGTLAT